jgi:uncharacterized protein YgiM (DUF1202 family)
MFRNRVTAPLLAAWLFFVLAGMLSAADGPFPFQAEVLESGVNIRADATVNSQIIAKANKGDKVTALATSYDWYKVTLPKDAAAFIKADLVIQLDGRTLQVEKDRVNIRSSPDESSPIIGKAKRNELVYYRGRSSGWYRIEPTGQCTGWIHKKFVKKAEPAPVEPTPLPEQPAPAEQAAPVPAPELQTIQASLSPTHLQILQAPSEIKLPALPKNDVSPAAPAPTADGELITLQGIVRFYGMVFKRPAAHKLVTKENKIFLLKGDRQALNAFTYHKVKVSGKILPELKAPYPVIEVVKIEALN